MKNRKIMVAMLVIVMVLFAFGCEQDPEVTPTEDQFQIRAYKPVALTHFDPLGEDDYDLPDGYDDLDEEGLAEILPMEMIFMLEEASPELAQILLFTIGPQPRSVNAAFYFSIRDEAFSQENDSFSVAAEIEHLDLLLAGGLNSLATLLALVEGDSEFEFPVELLEADGTMKASFFISGSVDELEGEEIVLSNTIAESGYIDLNVDIASEFGEGSELEGTVSGQVHMSIGTTIVSLDLGEGEVDYRYPLIYTIDIDPFSIDIAELLAFMDGFPPEELSYGDIAELLWGHREADGLSITRIVRVADGTEASSYTMTGAQLFELILTLISGPGGDVT